RTGHGLIATADEGLAIARDFAFKEPTPIDAIEIGEERVDGGVPTMTPGGSAAPAQLDDGPVTDREAPTSGRRRKPRRPAFDAPAVT
ncbi:MAG: hypothetical protein QOI00_1769, partial [Chloroflexota bacterium]|nr:hypothetical protein [Chloroflexota bacterium]